MVYGVGAWICRKSSIFNDLRETQIFEIHCNFNGLAYPCTNAPTSVTLLHGSPGGRPRVGWCGGEPSIVEGRLPCRSKPTATAGITFRSSDTRSPTGQRTMRACVPGVA